MSPPSDAPSTGLPALDAVIGGLRAGDNVVWQLDDVAEYAALVHPFVDAALAAGRRVIYFRFARQAPLVAEGRGAEVIRLQPAVGFESFTASIHEAIERAGRGACYVFDCLSDLAADWSSDLMLGSFFRVTCPYLFELDTVTYFGLSRGSQSDEAVDAIRSTTQLLLDVFRHGGDLHVHPLKVDGRRSLTMYLPHARRGDAFVPVTQSALLAQMLAGRSERRDAAGPLDVWERRFERGREVADQVRAGTCPPSGAEAVFRELLPVILTRDEPQRDLAARVLGLEDLLAIRRRMIGTGLVGGKALGVLLARAALAAADPQAAALLEPHDSWFVGSDVFYAYLVGNGCWRARRAQRDPARFLDGLAEARQRILQGTFPDPVVRRLVSMLEYYGQSPIIVRSSSLLEDGFGNAFTGKYDSIFCANQGSPRERLDAVLDAIRTVYASAMSEEALRYRADRGLLGRDEQMAILVQRVCGAVHGRYFFPDLAGVALSYNPYAWSPEIEPRAGVVRLVFGLGTRAVDRSDDDYTRIVALNAPSRRPDASIEESGEYAQRRVDVIDVEANRLASLPFETVVRESPDLPVELFASRRRNAPGLVLDFERVLRDTPLVERMRAILGSLRDAYGRQVDVEFTASFPPGGELCLSIVQCRPLQVREGGVLEPLPEGISEDDVLLRSRGPVVGPGTRMRVDRVVYVDPDAYSALPSQYRYEVARALGRLHRLDPAMLRHSLLLGPGRWGTSTVSLGVPVSFAEIRGVAAVCEIVRMGSGVVPDVSLGSHFFNDIVEADMLYLALHPTAPGSRIDEGWLRAAPNRLASLLPDDARLAAVIHVVDFPGAAGGRTLWLHANCVEQEVVCHLEPAQAAGGAAR